VKHHFNPAFSLQPWTGSDCLLCEMRRANGRCRRSASMLYHNSGISPWRSRRTAYDNALVALHDGTRCGGENCGEESDHPSIPRAAHYACDCRDVAVILERPATQVATAQTG
jgi:hypothetical protein